MYKTHNCSKYKKYQTTPDVNKNMAGNTLVLSWLTQRIFEIRPRDCLRNDSSAMTVFIFISLFPRDQWLELFNVGGFPTVWGLAFYSYAIFLLDFVAIPRVWYFSIKFRSYADSVLFFYFLLDFVAIPTVWYFSVAFRNPIENRKITHCRHSYEI
jgi:hypothetical protein